MCTSTQWNSEFILSVIQFMTLVGFFRGCSILLFLWFSQRSDQHDHPRRSIDWIDGGAGPNTSALSFTISVHILCLSRVWFIYRRRLSPYPNNLLSASRRVYIPLVQIFDSPHKSCAFSLEKRTMLNVAPMDYSYVPFPVGKD